MSVENRGPQFGRLGISVLAATRWQTISKVIIPAEKTGISTGVVLGLARAFGKALAVQMVISNSISFPKGILGTTSTLDPISTMKIEELMDVLKNKYTVIIVTHNMQQAGIISDNTTFFLNGEVIESGKTEDIFYKPKDKRTEDYITGRFG